MSDSPTARKIMPPRLFFKNHASLERDQERLYDLIWRQFVACQMTHAEYLSTSLTIWAGDFELKTRGRILVFDGYTAVQPPSGRSSEKQTWVRVQRIE